MKNIENKINKAFHNIDLPEFDKKKLNEKKGIVYMEKKKAFQKILLFIKMLQKSILMEI